MEKIEMPHGWYVEMLVDEDKHLNVYVTNCDRTEVKMVRCEEWGYEGDEISMRFTTQQIEDDYKEEA